LTYGPLSGMGHKKEKDKGERDKEKGIRRKG
jgi:hypothetical protein